MLPMPTPTGRLPGLFRGGHPPASRSVLVAGVTQPFSLLPGLPPSYRYAARLTRCRWTAGRRTGAGRPPERGAAAPGPLGHAGRSSTTLKRTISACATAASPTASVSRRIASERVSSAWSA